MLDSNYRLDYFEVLKDEGKYSEHPLERLTIKLNGSLDKLFGEIKLLTTVEKIWFSSKGYFECYRIEKNESKSFITDAKYVLVDVWDEAKCFFIDRQQAKQIGCLVR